MVDVPAGVYQRLDFPGGANMLVPVLPYEWPKFCTLAEANKVLADLKAAFPAFTFKDVYEDGEAAARFVYTSPQSPRVYVIDGTSVLQNTISEWAGEILTREIKPESEDHNRPYLPGDKLKMNFQEFNGIAEFYWAK